ncbi:hypothetical protein K9L63_02600 [Candidatus Gracilibacteria bacterium]|nr:hypothetical protein [Candidatus Gracilibacteria bacterium]
MPRRIRPHVNPLSITKEYFFEGFENNASIIVDMGACKGEFTEQLLEKFPEKNFILFEIRFPLAEKLREKFAGCDNVVVFDGDAGRNFESIVRPSVDRGVKLETIFVNFPDPWFKEKHKKRRFINEKFLAQCAEWISPETEFVFQTDQKFLFDETLEVVQDSVFSRVEFFDDSPHGIRTDWEEAKVREGGEVFRMKFWKR